MIARPAASMPAVRRWPRIVLALSLAAIAAGLVELAVAGLAFGDWYLIRVPWVDVGLGLYIVGLMLAGVAATWLVIVEPLGWWRLAALPGIVLTALEWVVLQVFGLGVSGACCSPAPAASLVTWFYSAPVLIPLVGGSTALILLPLALQRVLGRNGR
jgi:hypothetical protein